SVLGSGNESTATLAVDALVGFARPDATLALARFALSSPWELVRDHAAHRLQSRPKSEFVPALLSLLSAPIESEVETTWERGRLTYRHQFQREERDQRHVMVRDVALRNQNVPAAGMFRADPDDEASEMTWGMAPLAPNDLVPALWNDVRSAAAAQEATKDQQNEQIRDINRRVTHALRLATGRTIGDDPEEWWSWWDSQNEVYAMGPKPRTVDYVSTSVNYRTPSEILAQSSPSVAPAECFAAGTPVWTVLGKRPIEAIQVGDLVVSQDPDTGELGIQPVLGTSIRPAEVLVSLDLGSDRLQASKGHPLWVSGRGWILVKQLERGQLLHGIRGAHRLVRTAPGDFLPTYNLIVDRFHTYFVGQAGLFCHDNTEVEATSGPLPGYAVADN
ncbi:MAG TPA: polymorphic toxin-type HINT domain-containing protein, partial [Pirellulaceae bacterium]